MKIKKIISMSLLTVVGVSLIYATNRFVTRPYVSNAVEQKKADELVADSSEAPAEEAEKKLPEGKREDWNLLLVSPNEPLKEDISEEAFVAVDNGMLVDKRIVDAFTQLGQAAEAAGFPLVLVSSYRSISYQEQIFQGYINDWTAQGYTEEEAFEKVKETSTEPGFSEHHTGLAVDVVDEDWLNHYTGELLEAAYAESPGGAWLAKNARDYGFILRYPKGKEDQTSIQFEPWHFRYVGIEHAKYIEENELCLEEYLDLLEEK